MRDPSEGAPMCPCTARRYRAARRSGRRCAPGMPVRPRSLHRARPMTSRGAPHTIELVVVAAALLAPRPLSAQTHAPAAPLPAPSAASPSSIPPEERLTVDTTLDHAPRHPDELVTLSLENAYLSDLVRTMSEMTGKRFLIAAAPKSFQATVVSPQKVTVAEAYQAFL